MRILVGKYRDGVGRTTIVPGVSAKMAPVTVKGPKGPDYRAGVAAAIGVVSRRTLARVPVKFP